MHFEVAMKSSWFGPAMMLLIAVSLFPVGLKSVDAQAAPAVAVAATPPMGWNSWDSYGLTITEAQFRANVKIEADALKSFGWNYAVIDEGWFFFNPEDREKPELLHYAIDANGRYVPVPARFPSVGSASAPGTTPPAAGASAPKLFATIENTSFKALADSVHSQGLKFGIHIVRGIPRASVERNLPIADSAFHANDAADVSDVCPWDPTNWGVKNNAAGQAWYDSLLAQYAAWGVDLLKVDCISDHPYKVDEIRMIRKAIDKTGRPIVLSLSPGPTSLDHAAEVGQLANMWRISDDFWDYWVSAHPERTYPRSLSAQFATAAAWAPYAKPGNWPDADMLPIGHLGPFPGEGKERDTRFTPVEQQTLMTLWCMARSPLILGANLTKLDEPTLKLITNPDVLRIDQTATRSGQVMHSGDIIAWTADLPPDSPDGSTALAIFNVGESQAVLDITFEAFNIDPGLYHVKEVWTGKSLGKLKSIPNLTLEPHSSVLYLLKK
jgi:alpha-galactosidase